MPEWISDEFSELLKVIGSGIVFYVIAIVGSKLAGIRSFTKESGFDFLITLAMGALLATTVVDKSVSIVEGGVALIILYLLQTLIGAMRLRWKFVSRYIDNRPVLLMENGKMLHRNMRKVHITKYEINAKIRAHNVCSYEQIRAVVLEATGQISVVTYDEKYPLDPALLENVRDKL